MKNTFVTELKISKQTFWLINTKRTFVFVGRDGAKKRNRELWRSKIITMLSLRADVWVIDQVCSFFAWTNLVNKRFSIWLSGKFFMRDTAGSPEWARWLHLACSGSQSQRAIWFILPARGASHIIKQINVFKCRCKECLRGHFVLCNMFVFLSYLDV